MAVFWRFRNPWYEYAMSHDQIEALKKLPNTQLLEQTQSLVQEERRLGIQIIHRLKEISRRRLYSELGFSSLFVYLVKQLCYPETTAYRLMTAMELLTEEPELEKKIEAGKLSISTLSQVQSYCQAQKKENGFEVKPEEKQKILVAVEGCTRKQAEKVLASLHPEKPLSKVRESERPVAKNQTEIRMVIDDELLAKLKRIKGLLGHKNVNPSYAELAELMAEIVLEKIDPIRKAQKGKEKQAKVEHAEAHPSVTLEATNPVGVPTDSVKPATFPGKPDRPRSRYIDAQTQRAVWVNAGGRCEFVSPETGRRCDETHQLEIDHQILFGQGDGHDLANLTLLCRSHNIHAAFKSYGTEKMRRYVRQ